MPWTGCGLAKPKSCSFRLTKKSSRAFQYPESLTQTQTLTQALTQTLTLTLTQTLAHTLLRISDSNPDPISIPKPSLPFPPVGSRPRSPLRDASRASTRGSSPAPGPAAGRGRADADAAAAGFGDIDGDGELRSHRIVISAAPSSAGGSSRSASVSPSTTIDIRGMQSMHSIALAAAEKSGGAFSKGSAVVEGAPEDDGSAASDTGKKKGKGQKEVCVTEM